MSVLHLRILSPQRDQWQFRFWTDNENTATTRDLALAEIADLAAQAETYYYNGPARLDVGQRLFRWLDGPDGILSRAIADAHHGDGPLVLAIHAAKGLAHLPWETMADDRGFLVAQTNPAIVPARWHGNIAPPWPAPENRPLHTLFMAAAPEGGGAPLQFEVEEGRMFQAAVVQGKRLMELTVEESGCLADLGALVSLQPPGTFDIFHLTGHAGHDGTTPVFSLEDETGQPAPATADELAKAFANRRPRVVFLSGCRTAQNPSQGEEQSLAEALIGHGIRVALGWGRSVRDDHAILAAELLYRALATGESLPAALSATWQGMIAESASGWHLLRLHFDGAVPGPLVTAPGSKGRAKPAAKLPSEHFLIPGDRRTKVPGLEQFVGRRRLLQQGIRLLRHADLCGIVLHGTGGLGKSSVVSRWADRLQHDFCMVPVFGLCDEPALTQALAKALPHDAEGERHALQGAGDLSHRLAAAIEACEKTPLFVLDDFEQNQDLPRTGEPFAKVKPGIAPVLSALLQAVAGHGHARLLFTTRYQLPAASVPGLEHVPITPMDEADQNKRIARLASLYKDAARQPADLLQRAITTAGGNHRLLEWLFKVLDQTGLDHPALIAAMEEKEAKFREDVLAAALCAALPPAAHALLTALQVCEEPVPLAAVVALRTGPSSPATESAIVGHLATAVAWGLAYVWEDEEEPPHWLAASFLRPILGEPPAEAAPAVLAVLQKLWWDDSETWTEARVLELHRLALAAGDHLLACDHAHRICVFWLDKNRSREAAALAARTLEVIAPQRDPRLLRDLARALQVLGDGDTSAALFAEAAALHGDGDMDDEKAGTLFNHAGLLLQQGKLEEAEPIYRDQLLPFFTAQGDAGLRSRAVTLGQIADILSARGQLDEALRIRREEQLPVFEKLGDVRERAVTMGQIADILSARGQLDEALRIRREEVLPVFEKLGDVRSRAVTNSKIADILTARGQLDEALLLYHEDVLPALEKLGDVRNRAAAYGKVAAILIQKGELDAALDIYRGEQLPAMQSLGDARELIVTKGMVAQLLAIRGHKEDVLEVVTHLAWAWREARRMGLPEAGQIEEFAGQIGMTVEMLAQVAEQV